MDLLGETGRSDSCFSALSVRLSRSCCRLAALALAVASLGACALPVQPTGFLPDYANLSRIADVDFAALRIGALDTPTTPAIIAVNGAAWLTQQSSGSRAALAAAVEARLARECYRAALMHYPSPTIVTGETDLSDYRATLEPRYRLEVAVTDLSAGNGLLRWLINTYAGAVKLQAEFRLREARSNRLIAIFATRRVDPGYAHGGLNLYVLSARYCLERVAKDIARDLIPLMAAVLADQPWEIEPPPGTQPADALEDDPEADEPAPVETDPSKMSEVF